jgi:putative ABC transport system permease protein
MGGALGCLATLPFNGLSTGTMNQFSEITFSFRFGPRVLMQGVMLAVIMGLLGGILPAIRAVRMNIINALRER